VTEVTENDLLNESTETIDADEDIAADGDEEEFDAEIQELKKRVQQMQEEAEKIEAMQNNVEKQINKDHKTPNFGADTDNRSIYVGNVDYSTTQEELQEFFQSCGPVNRVTIMRDKWLGHPKGFAYVEFAEADAIVNAMILNETPLNGRPLKISPKRTNIPGFHYGARGGGAPRRARFRSRRAGYYGRRPYRPRRSTYYAPY